MGPVDSGEAPTRPERCHSFLQPIFTEPTVCRGGVSKASTISALVPLTPCQLGIRPIHTEPAPALAWDTTGSHPFLSGAETVMRDPMTLSKSRWAKK